MVKDSCGPWWQNQTGEEGGGGNCETSLKVVSNELSWKKCCVTYSTQRILQIIVPKTSAYCCKARSATFSAHDNIAITRTVHWNFTWIKKISQFQLIKISTAVSRLLFLSRKYVQNRFYIIFTVDFRSLFKACFPSLFWLFLITKLATLRGNLLKQIRKLLN